ncbi:hypothetical protein Tco_1347924, partial [Tanacetum coccineum]
VKDTTARDKAVVSKNKEKVVNAVKASACWGNPQQKEYKEKGVIDTGFSRHMTGNKYYLNEYEDNDGGFVSFGDGKGRISGTRDNIVTGLKDNVEDARVKPIKVDKSEASDKYRKDEQDSRTPSSLVNAAKTSEEHLFEQFSPSNNAFTLPDVPNVSPMDDNTGIFAGTYDDEDVGGQADLNNLETTMNVSSIPTTRLNKDQPIELVIGDLHSTPLTRRMSQQNLKEHCLVSYINKQRRTNHKDYQNCVFACFLSQKEPKKVIQALEDPSWI